MKKGFKALLAMSLTLGVFATGTIATNNTANVAQAKIIKKAKKTPI